MAAAFLAGDWDPPAMTRRGQRAVNQRRVWVRDLALAAFHGYESPPRDRPRELAAFIAACPSFSEAIARARRRSEPMPRVWHWFVAPTAMAERRWPVYGLDAVRDLQDMLGLTLPDLLWFADVQHRERTVADEPLRHYRYHWVPKRSTGVRLIEEPKPLLKHFQRVLLREILNRIPVHPAAHGFVGGRSAITFAAPHARRPIVVHLDLHDFFPSVAAGRVFGIFRQCGYPEPVAHLLTGLVTNAIPHSVLTTAPRSDPDGVYRRLGQHLRHAHLPQGAPTSPALANLAAYVLDRRLAGLASVAGASYSRYADDLAFSFETNRSDRQVSRFIELVGRIAHDEGFRVNTGKTSVRRAGQQQRLAGVVVNDRPNVGRRDYDEMKAILHNAVRHGGSSQNVDHHANFRAHVLGRIGWVGQLNAARGERLRAQFDLVDWGEAS